jgi:RNA polymerase sigma-70 factor (ECF subfamily)
MARNLALSRLKRMAHEREILAEIRNGTEEALTDDEILHRDYNGILQKAIASLPEQQRNVYILSRENGMSRRQIADSLGISTNTVKAHLSAATNNLRCWFDRHKGEVLALFIILHGGN